jgi:hypothetical protein
MTIPIAPVHLSLLSAVVVLATACGSPEAGAPQQGTSQASGSGDPSRTATAPTQPPATSAPGTTDRARGDLRIRIRVGDQSLTGTLLDIPAANDLVAQLPLTLTMTDHGSVEKTGALPRPLSTAGVPSGADPAVGDIGYYAPGNDFVMYYGDQSYYEGIVRLGTLDGDLDLLQQSDDLHVTLESTTD